MHMTLMATLRNQRSTMSPISLTIPLLKSKTPTQAIQMALFRVGR